jgi:divalent metal cation (Fe/Co/Zn/Cd) transporter
MGHDHHDYVHAHDPAAERRTYLLAQVGFAWHLIEAVAAIWLGLAASSIALVAFGLDSVIELFAGAVILWRMHASRAGLSGHVGDERRAARLIAWSFWVLAAYVTAHSTFSLLAGHHAGESTGGIVLAIITVVTMYPLARMKGRAAAAAGSASAASEARQTSLCVYLALVMLAGLVLNAAWGLWWADPAAALVIAGLAAREGIKVHRTGDIDCC